ncbi:MAG TPA: WGR domain-containing protein, partial [Sulfurovum sp.]|nr:WGR domain-containing protein [Sulfurovum sp.]
MKTENITLFYKQDKSDKVYKASLEGANDEFIVNFAYGRRGATLKTGTKTQTAVTYEKAKKIYDKLVLSKASKGYVPNEDSSEYVYESDQVKTGIHCQLLNPIDKEELQGYIQSDAWWMQEKKDGKRMLIKKTDELIAINRKGLSVGAPQSMMESASKIEQSFVVDGEAIGDVLYVFDLLFYEGVDIKEKSYS